jgi:hypothetical protein
MKFMNVTNLIYLSKQDFDSPEYPISLTNFNNQINHTNQIWINLF